MEVKAKFVWNTFDMIHPGEVFFYDGEFFLKMFSTDFEGKDLKNNAVCMSGEARAFEGQEAVFRCPNAKLTIEK